jgi:hypothetical protein
MPRPRECQPEKIVHFPALFSQCFRGCFPAPARGVCAGSMDVGSWAPYNENNQPFGEKSPELPMDLDSTRHPTKTAFASMAHRLENQAKAPARWGRAGAQLEVRHGGPCTTALIRRGARLDRWTTGVKTRTMTGFDASCILGWDCQGLALESGVEDGLRFLRKQFRIEEPPCPVLVQAQSADFFAPPALRLSAIGES